MRCLLSDKTEVLFDFLGEHGLGEGAAYRKVTGKETLQNHHILLSCLFRKRLLNRDCIVRPTSYTGHLPISPLLSSWLVLQTLHL